MLVFGWFRGISHGLIGLLQQFPALLFLREMRINKTRLFCG